MNDQKLGSFLEKISITFCQAGMAIGMPATMISSVVTMGAIVTHHSDIATQMTHVVATAGVVSMAGYFGKVCADHGDRNAFIGACFVAMGGYYLGQNTGQAVQAIRQSPAAIIEKQIQPTTLQQKQVITKHGVVTFDKSGQATVRPHTLQMMQQQKQR